MTVEKSGEGSVGSLMMKLRKGAEIGRWIKNWGNSAVTKE